MSNFSPSSPSTIHIIQIQNPPHCPTFDLIKSGQKTVEGRKYALKYRSITPGDYIKFICRNDTLLTTVTYVHRYRTLEEYLQKETLEKALPGISSFEEAVDVYNSWSTLEERERLLEETGYAFLGIGVHVVPSPSSL